MLVHKKIASNKTVHIQFNIDLNYLEKYILNPVQDLTICLRMCCKHVKY